MYDESIIGKLIGELIVIGELIGECKRSWGFCDFTLLL